MGAALHRLEKFNQQYVDAWILVNEDEIHEGSKLIFEQERSVIDGHGLRSA